MGEANKSIGGEDSSRIARLFATVAQLMGRNEGRLAAIASSIGGGDGAEEGLVNGMHERSPQETRSMIRKLREDPVVPRMMGGMQVDLNALAEYCSGRPERGPKDWLRYIAGKYGSENSLN